jgi:hypothetical protein
LSIHESTNSRSGKILAGGVPAVDPLWHANLGASVGNGPISYELDGIRYVVVAVGDPLWAFAINVEVVL